MYNAADIETLMARLQAEVEEARLLAARERAVRGDLEEAVAACLRDAHERPGLPAEEVKPDPATAFARRIRRRRTIV